MNRTRPLTRDELMDRSIAEVDDMCKVTDMLFGDEAYMGQIKKQVRNGTTAGGKRNRFLNIDDR